MLTRLTDLTPGLKLMLDLQYAFNRYRLYDENVPGERLLRAVPLPESPRGDNVNLDDRWSLHDRGRTSREPRLKNLYDAAEASTPAAWGSVMPQFAVRTRTGASISPIRSSRPNRCWTSNSACGTPRGMTRATLNGYWMEFSDEIVKSGQVDRFGNR